ncbi:hypothetical protein B9037_004980 [Klebsiella aerogenes]|uniref:DUF6708 domain-containing protein n=1 Tax=Klebsiella aerogenes TaxID=548 RepID=UPI000B408DC0|nr:DUF6708 domain-containing protein [Klebsiella aerogenes]MEB7638994.1 hypothetical protein [Klebsiella aerogenes]RNT35100.1 hypothetical protein B9037_004980 [Klebsiella aerogenes]HDS4948817.1 hypothetical protein [Klebsiella aerogenes]
MNDIKINPPPLFGITEVNDIYCDIKRNILRGNGTGVTIWLFLIIGTIYSLFLVGPLLTHSDEIFYAILFVIFILYYSIYVLRVAITQPKSLIIRLNRKRQRVYIQHHNTSYNIFARWPIETLTYDWKEIVANFKTGTGKSCGCTWYEWRVTEPSGYQRKFVISADHSASLFSRFTIENEDFLFSYAKSWAWCESYMRGMMTPVHILPPEPQHSFKYCMLLVSRGFLRADINDKWSTIIPFRNPFFWILALFMLPMMIPDALITYVVLRIKPDTPWSDFAQTESTSDS